MIQTKTPFSSILNLSLTFVRLVAVNLTHWQCTTRQDKLQALFAKTLCRIFTCYQGYVMDTIRCDNVCKTKGWHWHVPEVLPQKRRKSCGHAHKIDVTHTDKSILLLLNRFLYAKDKQDQVSYIPQSSSLNRFKSEKLWWSAGRDTFKKQSWG